MIKPNVVLALAILTGISCWKSLPMRGSDWSEADTPETSELATQSIQVYTQPASQLPVIEASDPVPFGQISEEIADPSQAGAAALAAGRYSEAIELLTVAVQQRPDQVQSWIDLGEAYLAVGDCDCAIRKLTRALELDPDNVGIFELRSQAYIQKGDYALAAVDAELGLELDPQNTELHLALAHAHEQLGDYETALTSLTTGLRRNPLDAELWNARANLRQLMGQVEAATADQQQAERIWQWQALSQQQQDLTQEQQQISTYIDTINRQGVAQSTPLTDRMNGNMPSTLTEFDSLTPQIQTNPNHPQVYLQRARTLWNELQQQGVDPLANPHHYQTILQDLNIAIVLDPTAPDPYLLRRQVYQAMGRAEDALSDVRTLEALAHRDASWEQSVEP
jgi:tetratricopeptide (TPR) repeat protein